MAVATSTPWYSSPTALARAERLARALEVVVADARVERQRHRHLEHPQRLDHRAALALVGVLLRREPAGGLHDVVVERGPEHRHEDRAVLRLVRLAAVSARSGIVTRLRIGLPSARAVDDIERDPERHPAEAGPARAVVQEDDGDEGGRRHQRAERGGHRQLAAADADVQRHLERAVAVGLAPAQRG